SLFAILKVDAFPKLTLDGADGAFDLATTAWAVGLADDVVNELGLEHASKVTILRMCNERAATIGAHGFRLSMTSYGCAQRRGGHGTRRAVGERVPDDEP